VVPVPTWVPPTSEERIVVTPDSARAPEGQKVGETHHFEFYVPDGTFPAAVPDLPEQAEIIFDDVSARLGISAKQKTRVTFRLPSPLPCPPRGLAGVNPPSIFIYADDETSRDQIFGVLAHEVGHILIMTRFTRIPRALNEGLATWASAPYFNLWLGNASLDAAVRSYLQDATYLPLHQNYYLTGIDAGTEERSSASCIARRETLYIEWASFLGHLIERHGMERLEALIRTVPEPEMTDAGIALKPADFETIYGSSLNQLEAAWLRHILGQRRSAAAVTGTAITSAGHRGRTNAQLTRRRKLVEYRSL
jgi:hypothetical protein